MMFRLVKKSKLASPPSLAVKYASIVLRFSRVEALNVRAR